jgi:hypothetical protein
MSQWLSISPGILTTDAALLCLSPLPPLLPHLFPLILCSQQPQCSLNTTGTLLSRESLLPSSWCSHLTGTACSITSYGSLFKYHLSDPTFKTCNLPSYPREFSVWLLCFELFLSSFWDMVLLCSSGWSWIDPPVSTSQMLDYRHVLSHTLWSISLLPIIAHLLIHSRIYFFYLAIVVCLFPHPQISSIETGIFLFCSSMDPNTYKSTGNIRDLQWIFVDWQNVFVCVLYVYILYIYMYIYKWMDISKSLKYLRFGRKCHLWEGLALEH